jgi:hypothetical protein
MNKKRNVLNTLGVSILMTLKSFWSASVNLAWGLSGILFFINLRASLGMNFESHQPLVDMLMVVLNDWKVFFIGILALELILNFRKFLKND